MGGKKKTKWRKLPLAEFTKSCESDQKIQSEVVCPPDLSGDDKREICFPTIEETTENGLQYNYEPTEYMDGAWYPTSCVVYNPAEIALYPQYIMPTDACYYYYTMPEAAPVQEYVPVPYQEYTTPALKDTVYLLLPTQTVRPSHGLPHVVPDWQNRRRRRRYEGYAEYAVIPEKANSSSACSEEKDRGKKGVQNANSRRNSNPSTKKMTSSPETSGFSNQNSSPAKKHSDSELSQTQGPPDSMENCNAKGSMSLSSEIDQIAQNSAQKRKKSLELCGVHTKRQSDENNVDMKESQSLIQTADLDSMDSVGENFESISEELIYPKLDVTASQKDVDSLAEKSSNKLVLNTSLLNSVQDLPVIQNSQLSYESSIKKLEDPGIQNDSPILPNHIKRRTETPKNNCQEFHDIKFDLENDGNTKSISGLELNSSVSRGKLDNILSQNPIKEKKIDETLRENSQSSLPDILTTVNKSLSNNVRATTNSPNNNRLRNSNLPEKINSESDKSFKSKSFSPQNSILPNLLSSDSLHNEMEIELKQLTHLQSLQTNQSIYKLAYDENVTDQSEADSRSPSPVDPETQVPSSLTSAEILIHEADSGSEAGSEDVELIPHRYESETFLNENKHVYVNKLSLAVELLRTQESLPYDDEFKRVVGENNLGAVGIPPDTGGKVNLGFVDDSYSPHGSDVHQSFASRKTYSSSDVIEGIRQSPQRLSRETVICREVSLDDSLGESCEVAKEATAQTDENQDSTEDVIAGYRTFGIHARHYFSPRAALVNPCFCCIIM